MCYIFIDHLLGDTIEWQKAARVIEVPVFEGRNVALGEMAIKVVKTARNHQHEVWFSLRRSILTYDSFIAQSTASTSTCCASPTSTPLYCHVSPLCIRLLLVMSCKVVSVKRCPSRYHHLEVGVHKDKTLTLNTVDS